MFMCVSSHSATPQITLTMLWWLNTMAVIIIKIDIIIYKSKTRTPEWCTKILFESYKSWYDKNKINKYKYK